MYSQEEIREAGLDDFRVFLAQVWDYLDLPPPTRIQNRIAWYLQHGGDRIIIEAFRGVGKSWITVAFTLWNLFIDPQKKIEVVSASSGLADDFSTFAKQLIHGMPLLGFLKPKMTQRRSNKAFDVGPANEAKSPSVKSAGITGQITGSRADIIIPDDVEVPKNSYTAHLREKLRKDVEEFESILKPNGRIIYLGTPHYEESLYPFLHRERNYDVRIWPAEVPEDTSVYEGNLAPIVKDMIEAGEEPGTPVDPERFPRPVLARKKASKGKSGYALQFLLDTTPASADKHPLKLRDLMVMDCDPDMGPVKLAWGSERKLVIEDLPAGGFSGDRYHAPAWRSDEMTPYSGTVMAIDPSGQGQDETSYAIVRFLHGNLYVVDVGGFKDGFAEETLQAIAAAASRYKVNKIVAEDNFGGGMFRQLLKPVLAQYNLDDEANDAGVFDEEWNAWSTGKKEWRILDTLEPIFGSHKLIVDRSVIEDDLELLQSRNDRKYSLIYQLTRMHREKGALRHEDRLEAIAIGCQYWVERMNRDADRELERHQERLRQKMIDDHMEHAIGKRWKRNRRIKIR